jgi:hypothetical protein
MQEKEIRNALVSASWLGELIKVQKVRRKSRSEEISEKS